ncbi:MAG: hypothetical protein NTW04_04365 [Elusimicrobia bacterium]|nr:hypothetical protein [Elusimicrobiota bacterium]
MIKAISKFLFKSPTLFNIARSIYRISLRIYNKLYTKLPISRSPNWNLYISVNPNLILKKSNIATNKFRDMGKIKDGDWDLDIIDFKSEYPYYESLKSLTCGGKWQDTPLFSEGIKKLERGKTAFSCKNREELEQRASAIIELYNDIKKNGYRAPKNSSADETSDEVSVNIGRNGEILFDDGGHRLSAAQLLGVKTIPAQVAVRHKKWDDFRRRLLLEAKQNNGMIYQKVHHPDLEFIPAAHDPKSRVEIISPQLPKGGKLLDIGANWGMFCHYFEDMGFECFAVENDPIHIEMLNRIKNMFGKKFALLPQSVFDINLKQYKFKVALALNIFHHFIKTRQLHDRFVKFLSELNAEIIIFEPHNHSEFEGLGYYKNYKPQEFVEVIKQFTGRKNSQLIGTADDGRPIYKIW